MSEPAGGSDRPLEAIRQRITQQYADRYRDASRSGNSLTAEQFWSYLPESERASFSEADRISILSSLKLAERQLQQSVSSQVSKAARELANKTLTGASENTVTWKRDEAAGSESQLSNTVALHPPDTTVEPQPDGEERTVELDSLRGDEQAEGNVGPTMPPVEPEQTALMAGDNALGSGDSSSTAFSWDPDRDDPKSYRSLKGTPLVSGYEILDELGRGGMGVVYHARHRRLKRDVALKMILAGAHASTDQLRRFRAEAEAVAHLQHPNIVQIYDVGEQDGLPYFSLEFVDGLSLEKHLDGKPQVEQAAAEMVETLARAMSYAHQQGIVHRDLKPANVLLTSEGVPKITDFGLVKRLEAEDSSQTRTGTIMGSPSYMAPEQGRGEKDIGPLADVYALGSILYAMLTGRPPFLAPTAIDILMRLLKEDPIPPSKIQPKVSRDLETICLKCLQKEPARRYASADELADDLRRFLNGEPILARAVGPRERAWRWCRRNPVVASLSAAILLLLVAVAAGSTVAAVRFNQQRQIAEQHAESATIAQGEAEKASDQARIAQREAEENAVAARQAQEAAENEKNRAENLAKVAGQQRQLALQSLQTLVTEVQEELKDTAEYELKQRLLETALVGLRKVADSGKQSTIRDTSMAGAHQRMGRIFELLGKHEEARQQYEQLHALLIALGGSNPDDDRLQRNLSISFNMLGNASLLLGEKEVARDYYREAMALRKERADLNPHNMQAQIDLAVSFVSLAQVCGQLDEREQALDYYRQALNIRQQLADQAPESERDARQRDVWVSIAGLADFHLLSANEPAAAIPHYMQALQVASELSERRSDSYQAQFDLAVTHANLGRAHAALEESGLAQQHFSAALELFEFLAQKNEQHLPVHTYYALTLARAGQHERAAQRTDALQAMAADNFSNLYNVACVYALCAEAVGRQADASADAIRRQYQDAAVQALTQSVQLGLKGAEGVESDPDLNAVREHPDYPALIGRLKAAAEPEQVERAG